MVGIPGWGGALTDWDRAGVTQWDGIRRQATLFRQLETDLLSLRRSLTYIKTIHPAMQDEGATDDK